MGIQIIRNGSGSFCEAADFIMFSLVKKKLECKGCQQTKATQPKEQKSKKNFCQECPFHMSSSFHFKLISNAPYRSNPPAVVILDLFTQTFDMDIYGSGITDIFIAPDVV